MKYLQECCDFVHELEDISKIDEGHIEDGSSQHEHDGVQVLNLRIVHYRRNNKVGAYHNHHNGDNYGTLKCVKK